MRSSITETGFRGRTRAAGLVMCISSVAAAQTVSLVETFDGPLSDRLITTAGPGFAVTLEGGEAVFSKASGTGNGSARITASFAVLGDFVATVRAERVLAGGNAESGLLCQPLYAPGIGGFADVFFVGTGGINTNLLITPAVPPVTRADAASRVTFRIERSGQTISLAYDAGSGFVTTRSVAHPNYSAPMRIALFLLQEFGQTAPHETRFDTLTITADGVTCAVDRIHDGSLNVFDIIDYFNAFGSGDPSAELTGDSPASLDVFDILTFFERFANGCI